MHDSGLRMNGGIGFAIDSPSIIIEANITEKCTVNDKRKYRLTNEANDKLIQSIEEACNIHSLSHGVSIDISGDALANHGFGSGTAIRLSCLEALMILNNVEVISSELVRLSGRGGTSGIGVNTYFSGGMIIDAGVIKSRYDHKPSSLSTSNSPSLVLKQFDMPDWDIGICIPENIKPLTHKQEKEFFKNTCPIKESEAHKALYHSVAGVCSSILDLDKDGFEYSVRELQKCEWKKSERELHGDELSLIEKTLYDCGASTVGMSSLGPSLFFLSKDVGDVIRVAKGKLTDCKFFKTKPTNCGRQIKC